MVARQPRRFYLASAENVSTPSYHRKMFHTALRQSTRINILPVVYEHPELAVKPFTLRSCLRRYVVM